MRCRRDTHAAEVKTIGIPARWMHIGPFA